MPYLNRFAHDADSHVMEPPGWYDPFLTPRQQEQLAAISPKRNAKFDSYVDGLVAKHDDAEYRAGAAEEVMTRKLWEAPGSFRKEDRPLALDALGFASQFVFTTSLLGPLIISEHKGDPSFAYELAEGHNRAIVDFCSVDARLLPVGYLPLVDMERTAEFVQQAIDSGCVALMAASKCPKNHAPSHVGLDPTWDALTQAGVPLVFHVGGGDVMNPTYKENGLAPVKDFIGGDTNFTSVSFMPIASAPMQSLATMIFDGVLERFPALKIGVIEQGAGWVPSWMRMMDSAADAFGKEDRLQKLSLKPSEFVRRQIRVTPYPHEDVGWVIKNSGPEICLFNSDFPHTEGGRNPVKRFEASLDAADCTAEERDAFYANNMVDLVGALR